MSTWWDGTTAARSASLLEAKLRSMGDGDPQQGWFASTAREFSAQTGTAAAPDTVLGPVVKISRKIQITQAQLDAISPGQDGSEHGAALVVNCVANVSCEAQSIGIFGGATTSSTAVGGTPGGNDAGGIYGFGLVTGSGTGVAIGGFFIGKRDNSLGAANALEVNVDNRGAAGSYNSTGFSDTTGIWLNCAGTADSGVGISLSNGFGFQFEVGLAFTGQVTGGKTGGVKTATIRDDGNATRVFDINGSHTDILDTQGATISGKLFKITTPGTYAATNVTTDRTYDANATTLDELADVVGTLIGDLRTLGLVT